MQRPGAAACAISFADDGLAGKHLIGLPGISIPVAIVSWPFTSALLHCEDAGLGAYNLLLNGAAKVNTISLHTRSVLTVCLQSADCLYAIRQGKGWSHAA